MIGVLELPILECYHQDLPQSITRSYNLPPRASGRFVVLSGDS